MKKILFLIAFVTLIGNVSAQKFVYGNLNVSKNAIIKGNITASYISNDSLSVDGQFITYVAGDSIPDLTWVRNYSDTNFSYFSGAITDGAPTNAEIVAIVGAAATNGAGFKADIKDTDGTLLIYSIICDGTDYYYITSTKSL